MKRTLLPIGLALALLPAAAEAQARATASFQLDLPVILPQLVVVTPGVQVVPDCDHEVFFTNGYYWVRHDHGWYRSKHHRGGWVLVPGRGVPAKLVRLPPGQYKRWKPAKHERRHHDDDRREHDGRDHHDGDRHDRGHDRDDDHDRGHGKKGKHGKH